MRAIHLCIDMQKGYASFFTPAQWQILRENISETAALAKSNDIPTIYVAVADVNFIDSKSKPYTPVILQSHSDVQKTLNESRRFFRDREKFDFAVVVDDQDLVAIKNSYSAARNRALLAHLTNGNYDTVILSGIAEAISEFHPWGRCVTETARELTDYGYTVHILGEATNAYTGANGVSALSLTARQKLHDQFGVYVTSIGELLLEKSVPPRRTVPARQSISLRFI